MNYHLGRMAALALGYAFGLIIGLELLGLAVFGLVVLRSILHL